MRRESGFANVERRREATALHRGSGWEMPGSTVTAIRLVTPEQSLFLRRN